VTNEGSQKKNVLLIGAAIAAALAALAVLGVPWIESFPFQPVLPAWLRGIAQLLPGAHFQSAAADGQATWALSLPGAVFCVGALGMLAKSFGKRRPKLGIGSAGVGLLAGVTGSAVAQLGGSETAAMALLMAGCTLFGLGSSRLAFRFLRWNGGRIAVFAG